jgi:hypothetical protein
VENNDVKMKEEYSKGMPRTYIYLYLVALKEERKRQQVTSGVSVKKMALLLSLDDILPSAP